MCDGVGARPVRRCRQRPGSSPARRRTGDGAPAPAPRPRLRSKAPERQYFFVLHRSAVFARAVELHLIEGSRRAASLRLRIPEISPPFVTVTALNPGARAEVSGDRAAPLGTRSRRRELI